jgi:hypothetical protein
VVVRRRPKSTKRAEIVFNSASRARENGFQALPHERDPGITIKKWLLTVSASLLRDDSHLPSPYQWTRPMKLLSMSVQG